MIERSLIKKIDRKNMYGVLFDFPVQVCDAVDIASATKIENLNYKGINNIIINGLGGSAIGGDLLRSYSGYELKIPIVINRNYHLPAFADKNTLVIISSYSGNTEETISAYKDAIERKCRIVVLTSGGVIEKAARKNKNLLIKIPGGLQPRCAIGYSFFSLLILFVRLGLLKDRSSDINDTIITLEDSLKEYSNTSFEDNQALRIASLLAGKLPVVYSSVDVMDVVNLRWRGQLSENSKILAYGNLFPEMNHNELVGWKLNEDILKKIVVLMLQDVEDEERIKHRMRITEKIFRKYAANIVDVRSEAKTLLARIFDLIYLGDWVSFYLAVLNGVDPTPVDAISKLKKELDKLKT